MPLTGQPLSDPTSSAEASPVSPTAWPASGKDLAMPVTSGVNLPEPFATFDPATSSLKMYQVSLLPMEDGSTTESCRTWPRSGTMRNGRCYRRPMSGHHTGGSGSGLWLTPAATDADPITGGNLYQTTTGTVRHLRPDGRSSNRGLTAQVLWPTPQAHDCTPGNPERVGRFGTKHGGRNLNDEAAKFPTPTGDDANNVSRASGAFQSLARVVNQFPTPKSRDWKGQTQRGMHAPMDGLGNLDRGDGTAIAGALNPDWVGWLMGYPTGWTLPGGPSSRPSPVLP